MQYREKFPVQFPAPILVHKSCTIPCDRPRNGAGLTWKYSYMYMWMICAYMTVSAKIVLKDLNGTFGIS